MNDPMFCHSCHYDLQGSTGAHRCPECGRAFNPDDRTSFLAELPKPISKWTRGAWIIAAGLLAWLAACLIQVLAAAPAGGH